MSAIKETREETTTFDIFGATLTRSTFVKGAGAMVVGLSLVGSGIGAQAASAAANARCSTGGNPIAGRPHGGGERSMVRPCFSAIATQGLRSAECSQPHPRSSAKPDRSTMVHARPPNRARASTSRQGTAASCSRRAAAMPAAPPPTIRTSVSLTLIGGF